MSSPTLEFIILSSSISPAGLEGCFGEQGRRDGGNDSLVVAEAKATGPSQVDMGAMVEAHRGESEAGMKTATVGTLGFVGAPRERLWPWSSGESLERRVGAVASSGGEKVGVGGATGSASAIGRGWRG